MTDRTFIRLSRAAVTATALALALLGSAAALAQGQVRTWGMAGTRAASPRGLAAVMANPANLALDRGTEIGLPEAAVLVGNNSLSLDRYNEITGSYLDSADKDALMADIPAAGFSLEADASASAVGVRAGAVAFTIGARGQGRGNLDRDYFDLLLYGNAPDRTVDFSDTWGGGFATAEATVSFGTDLVRNGDTVLAAGVSLRYLQGLYELHIDRAGGFIDTRRTGIDGEAYVDAVSADGGAGYGMDLGLAWQRAGWSLGLAVENAAGGLDWDSGLQRDSYEVSATALNLADGNFDAAVTDLHTTGEAAPYHTALPRTWRLGAGFEGSGVAMGLDISRQEGYLPGQGSRAGAAAGLEWQPTDWFRPRAGLRYDEQLGTGGSLGLGLGLGPWRVDAAMMTVGGLMPGTARGFGAAVGTHLEF